MKPINITTKQTTEQVQQDRRKRLIEDIDNAEFVEIKIVIQKGLIQFWKKTEVKK